MDIFANTRKGKYDLGDETRESGFNALIWSVLGAFVIMTICSRSSFLYVYNLWDDANSYFTMGKCIFRGMVPYRDLFDQKGIMLYFIYGFASLISSTTFKGVFIFEVIAAAASLLGILKIYQLFLEPSTFPYIATPITGAVIYSSWNFYWGGSAEEFLFPYIVWGLYLSVRYFRLRYPKPMGYDTVLAGGILAGCVLNIKFNSLGFFFAWMAMVFFADLIGERAIVKAFASCLVFLGGMLLATLPWISYFGANRAIGDWLYVYIYKNVFEYSASMTAAERVAKIYDILKNHFLGNTLMYSLMILGMLYFLFSTISSYVYQDPNMRFKRNRIFVKVSIFEFINISALFSFLMLGIFIGGVSLPYYSFPTNVFVLFGFIPFCYIIEKFLKSRIERHTHGRDYTGSIMDTPVAFTLSIVAMVLGIGLSFILSVNPKVMGLKADELWLYKFRDYIEDSGVEDPGIINMYCFDTGIYTVLDVEPICYYYQTQTLNMQEVIDYQKTYLHSGEADFLLTCDVAQPEGIGDRYDLVMSEKCKFYMFDHTYYLFQRNENPVQDEG